LHLAVKKPDASVAAGALVGVYHRYFNEDYGQIVYECVWEDEADLQGQINIPNAMAKDGNDYWSQHWARNRISSIMKRCGRPALISWTALPARQWV
jgi:hypothetical protein